MTGNDLDINEANTLFSAESGVIEILFIDNPESKTSRAQLNIAYEFYSSCINQLVNKFSTPDHLIDKIEIKEKEFLEKFLRYANKHKIGGEVNNLQFRYLENTELPKSRSSLLEGYIEKFKALPRTEVKANIPNTAPEQKISVHASVNEVFDLVKKHKTSLGF